MIKNANALIWLLAALTLAEHPFCAAVADVPIKAESEDIATSTANIVTVERPPSEREERRPKHRNNHTVDVLEEKMSAMNLSTQAKIRRLKNLRAEAKLLAAQLKRQRHQDKQQKDDPINGGKVDVAGEEHLSKWQKKMRHRVRAILKRLGKLEKQIRTQKQSLKEARRARVHVKSKTSGVSSDRKIASSDEFADATQTPFVTRPNRKAVRRSRKPPGKTVVVEFVRSTPMPAVRSSEGTTRKMLEMFHQARNKSKHGEDGSVCLSHNECRPGLCCQRTKDAKGNVFANCARYALKEGQICEHSCSCEARLQCFRDTNRNSDGSAKPARCKKASTQDVLAGVYENTKEAVFERRERRNAAAKRFD